MKKTRISQLLLPGGEGAYIWAWQDAERGHDGNEGTHDGLARHHARRKRDAVRVNKRRRDLARNLVQQGTLVGGGVFLLVLA